jgi:hypothetical protein
MVSSIQSNNFKTSVLNFSFSLSNNETYLSISVHSRRKSIVFFLQIIAITRSDEFATRLRLVTQIHPHE